MYNNDVDFEILKMFYNNYLNIDEIALKLGMSEDEINKILGFYYDKYFFDIPYQNIIISDA
jgi:hypothetical protein